MVEGPLLLLIIALSVVFIVVATSGLKLHPFLALLLATLGVGVAVGLPLTEVVKAINTGFGNLMGYIGLVVVLGSIIGVVLEKSGAALRLAEVVLRLVGPRKPAMAMAVIGMLVGIPVFCDSGFIILSGINKALAKRSAVRTGTLTIALASGLYTSHTLIPPTPGPIAAAGNVGAADHLGIIILLGLVIAVPVMLVAYLYALYFDGKTSSLPADQPAEIVETESSNSLPGIGKSLAPIVVPIFLISMASVVSILPLPGAVGEFMTVLGLPLVALLGGVFCCLPLLPRLSAAYLTNWVGEGVQQAGPILILTGAGGAFGAVLKATPIAALVQTWIAGAQASGGIFLIISFLVAALLKTSQGSTTSALVITSSLLAPVLTSVGFDSPLELGLLVMAIGGGSMVVSHTNDSYFWVITQFSGLPLREAYRGFTAVTFLQGVTALATVLLLYSLFA